MVHTSNAVISLQNMDEVHFWENRPFSGVIPAPKRKPDIKIPMKKKVKRYRTAYTTKQLRALELLFAQNKYITPERRREISKTLNLGDKNVKIWFQNRRMKEKRESSESSRTDSDSSNETPASCEQSPLSVASIEPHEPCQNETVMNENVISEINSYQVPYFNAHNTNEEQFQNVHTSDYNTWQANNMQFYNSVNMYPTQYYPYESDTYIHDYHNYGQYRQESPMQNYWGMDNFTPCYFYNEG